MTNLLVIWHYNVSQVYATSCNGSRIETVRGETF